MKLIGKNILPLLLCFSFCSSALGAHQLEIILFGHPTLTTRAVEVEASEIKTPQFQLFLKNLIFTLKKSGGVGLAAPQVNNSSRIFAIKRNLLAPLTIAINPEITYLEEFGQQRSTEGCLSIPGTRITVNRYKRVLLRFLNQQAQLEERILSGFEAIIAQHEYDHLEGVLITDYEGFYEAPDNYVEVPLM